MIRTSAALALEEQAQRNPYDLSTWLSYTKHLTQLPEPVPAALFAVYERAVAALPGSYKLWRAYASSIRAVAATYHPSHIARRAALDVSKRAAHALRASPVLWLDYIRDALRERLWTEVRLAANSALQSLPISQHDRVWALLLDSFVGAKGVPHQTSILLLRRYAKLRPGRARERLYRHLLKAHRWDEAVTELCSALADPNWIPEEKNTREQLWMELARVASRHPKDITSVDVPVLLRTAIATAKTDVGELWVVFGQYYSRMGMFDDTRAVYEEAMAVISTVRDFALIFDAYAKFEETLVTAAMEEVESITKETEQNERDSSLKLKLKETSEMVEQLIAELEQLSNRRPMLLSDVVLRQNPHNVHEWHKRARMFKHAKDAPNVVDTYTKAVRTVDPWRATNGRPHTLWLAFAHYYEDAQDLVSARKVLDKAVSNPEFFKSAEDLAAVWCEYAEMELRRNTPQAALEILHRGTTQLPNGQIDEEKQKKKQFGNDIEAAVNAGTNISHVYDNSSPAWNAFRSLRTWHFLIDLSQSISTPEEVIDLHNKMLELRLASPQTILSGTSYLESRRLFEQAFRLYDKATSAVQWPEALTIWVMYLSKFVQRFGARKLERARDLFEEAIRSAPTSKKGGHHYPHPQLRLFYIMYSEMEEKYSLARHSLAILARAVNSVREDDRPAMYKMYIVKTATLFGVTKTRPIYEAALSSLARSEDILEFGLRYAVMEKQLGEIDRARAVYRHVCQVANTRAGGIYAHFWKTWHDFELAHGSEDTFRDMLREKRAVQLQHRGVIMDSDLASLLPDAEGSGSGIQNMVRAPQKNSTEMEMEKEDKAAEDDVNGEIGGDDDAGQNNEEIDIDLSDDDENGDDADKDDEEHIDPPGPVQPEGSTEKRANSNNLRIEQRDLPEGVKRLIGAAHAHKRQRDTNSEEEIGQVRNENPTDGDVGAVKRPRQNKETKLTTT